MILNASAGSGKTYNLVKEYLLILLEEKKDLSRFSRIIAMTFTNKAALEMKTRIIKALDELSYTTSSNAKTDNFALDLAKNLSITPVEVRVRAKTVLQSILHRYEDFFVMTIDKFNLKLIRSFSRDLDLPSDFEVILNESEVIEQVVDLLLNQLGKENLKPLTNLVFKYAINNLDNGEKWNFRDQLITFGKILSVEREQNKIDKLLEMDFSFERHTELKTSLRQDLELFAFECKKVYDFYVTLGINPSQLPGVTNSSRPIEQLASIKEIDSERLFTESFLKNASSEPPKGKYYPSELRTSLLRLNETYLQLKPKYFVKKEFLRNFFNMALLQYLAKSLESVKKDEQLIRISEFNKLISELVRNEDAPFIYERLGTRFQNFLLDEFQDTSRLQWLNMVPLVHESISNLNKNLIVGDPKQSIYRFKNGVAEQFVALPSIYNPENDPGISQKSMYFDQLGHVKTLDDNWRSSPTIVDFNNSFFTNLKEKLPVYSKEFYNSIHQNAKSNVPGWIDISSQHIEKDSEINLVDEIIRKIEACEKDGFKRGDICILCDRNWMANEWAVDLTKKGYKVVSAESLLVQNEVKVKLIVSYLKRRLNPSSSSEKKRFSELYFRINKTNAFDNFRTYFEKGINDEGKEYTYFNDDKFIADNFGGRSKFFCKFENLYDLIQSFYRMMDWDELKNPYLHHFADFAHEFELAKGPDIKSFLSYYNEQKSKLAIQLPESDDAIKIMTIHKSKGLEFPVVIIPFVDFSLNIMKNAKFLIEVDDLILYTGLTKESPISNVVDFRSIEMEQVLTDRVNQCYVAFTRPMERLYIMNYYKEKSFGSLIHECISTFAETVCEEDGSIHLHLGSSSHRLQEKTKESSVFFKPENISDKLWFPDISLQDQEKLGDKGFLSKEQRFGTQFHLAMAKINGKETIQPTIEQMIAEGEIESEFAHEIKLKINSIFGLSEFEGLFEGSYEILNEQSIILNETDTKRPDKLILKEAETIILDYKTGVPTAKDEKQMREYIATIQSMDFPAVKGYIFYTFNNTLKALN